MRVVTDAAAEDQAAEAHAQAGAARQEQRAILGRDEEVVVECRGSRGGGAPLLVDVEAVEPPQVDDQTFAGREAGITVPASASRGLDAVLGAPGDAGHDVGLVRDTRHSHGPDVEEAPIPGRIGCVIAAVAGQHQGAGQAPAQVLEGRLIGARCATTDEAPAKERMPKPRPRPTAAVVLSRRKRRREIGPMELSWFVWMEGALRGPLAGGRFDDLEGLHHAEVLVGQDVAVLDELAGEIVEVVLEGE